VIDYSRNLRGTTLYPATKYEIMIDVEARFLQNNFTDSRTLLFCSDSVFGLQSPCHEATGEGTVLGDSESD